MLLEKCSKTAGSLDSLRWAKEILPALKQMSLKILVEKCAGKLSRRALIDLRSGRSRPHPKNEKFLAEIVCILSSKSVMAMLQQLSLSSSPEPSSYRSQVDVHFDISDYLAQL
jgi:hypothetical protein